MTTQKGVLMSTSIPILNFNLETGLTIARNKTADNFSEGVKKNLILDLLSVIEKISSQTEEPVKADFYSDWLPLIRTAVVKAEKALCESDMSLNRPKNKDSTTTNHKDSGGEG